MPRASITDKFFVHAPKKKGSRKGQRMMGMNYRYNESMGDITVQDLIDFLKKSNIDPSNVPVNTFVVWTKA